MANPVKRGPYAVVKFENDSFGVVPVKWMFRDNSSLFCYHSSSRQRVVDLLDANPNWSVYRIIKIYGRAGNLVCSVYDISFSCLKLMRFLCEHFIHLTKKCRPFDDKYSFYVIYEAVIHDIFGN
jgi:hypothetical protein